MIAALRQRELLNRLERVNLAKPQKLEKRSKKIEIGSQALLML